MMAEDFFDVKILDNQDTLLTKREAGNFSFSSNVAFSPEKNSDGLKIPLYPDDVPSPQNPLLSYQGDWGYGLHFSLSTDYMINDILGIGLAASPLSYRKSFLSSSNSYIEEQVEHIIMNKAFYLLLKPYLMLSIPGTDIDVSVGLEYQKLFSSSTTYRTSFSNSSEIFIDQRVYLSPNNHIIAFSYGIRYKLLTAFAGDNSRINIYPYLNYTYTPKYFETFGSASANNSIRMGVSVSLGFDDLNYDTLRYEERKWGEPIKKIRADNNLKTKNIQGIKADEANEIDVKIYEPGFAELHPVDNYKLDKEIIDYLNDILHIINSNDDTVIEIKIIQSDKSTQNHGNVRKAGAMINYLLENGAESKNIKKAVEYNDSVDQKIEINIIN
jgi:hypothetical protein